MLAKLRTGTTHISSPLFASYDVSASFPAAPYLNESLPHPAPATPGVPSGRERIPQ